jgi:triosephosphate isomerase
MRKKIIAGNWKMNKDIPATEVLINELKSKLQNEKINADVIVCPPFTSLETAGNLLKNSFIKLGAQNMYFEDEGAFTGEISASMLKSAGCELLSLGIPKEEQSLRKTMNSSIRKLKKPYKAD